MDGNKKQIDIKILDYTPERQPYFERLNREWIELYFEMEPLDYEILQNPQKHIIDLGGSVLFAEADGEIIGTVGLKPEGENIFELAKMAVTEKFRGSGAGKLLGEAALKRARQAGAKKVVLYTNKILEPAIRLYRRLGFREVLLKNTGYQRADYKMEIDFE